MAGPVVIVGASHAGTAAADLLRRTGFDGPISLISREAHLPYQRPPLSKSIDLSDLSPDRISIRKEEFFAEAGISLVCGRAATAIDTEARLVRLDDGETLEYENLVLAIGARARPLAPGVIEGVPPASMRTLDDALDLRRRLEGTGRIIIIGAGLIGLEIAAFCRLAGVAVTVLETAPHILGRVLPPSTSAFLKDHHERAGIGFRFGVTVARVTGTVLGYRVELAHGETLDADLVLTAIGTEPEVELARHARLALENGIAVSACGQTSMAGIWAIGDCASWQLRPAFPRRMRFEGIQPATEQARIVARAIAGETPGLLPVPRFWSHQGDWRLQMAGVLSPEAGIVRHGDPQTGSFCDLALVDDRVVACYAVNSSNDFKNGVQLIERGIPLANDEPVPVL